MKVERQIDGTWLATGEGELRPILAEGNTRAEARHNFHGLFGEQYAEAQSLTQLSLIQDGKKYEDARLLAADIRSKLS